MTSKQAGPSLIHTPALFSIVEQGVYRCASPTAAQVPFLATLNLKTVISLTPEHPIRPLLQFTRSNGIDFLHLGTTLWRPLTDWKPVNDDVVKAALEVILDVRNQPVLLIDPLGIHNTGCVVGALRIMQKWNFASVLVEYRSHSGPTKHRLSDEHFIELFDPDLINLPRAEFLPKWFQTDGDDADTDWEEEETQCMPEAAQVGPTPDVEGDKAGSSAGTPSPKMSVETGNEPHPREPSAGVG